MPKIEIVSHPLCPYTQRLVLIGLLADKQPGRDYTLTHLPYATLAQTLAEHSPTGELPVLVLDEERVSTNTDAIAEWMDDQLELGLMPQDPDARLRVRDGQKLVGQSLDLLRVVYTAADRAALDEALEAFFASLERIEDRLDETADPGSLTHLGYVALAPLGSLIDPFALLREHAAWDELPKLRARLHAASRHPTVRASRAPDFEHEFDEFFAMTGSAFPTLASA